LTGGEDGWRSGDAGESHTGGDPALPDGERYTGQAAVRAYWDRFFAASPHAVFETEEMFACGDRGVVRWVYRWEEPEGRSGHVRGMDIFRVREGKVAEKFSYVKG